jgi:hypothetical protein
VTISLSLFSERAESKAVFKRDTPERLGCGIRGHFLYPPTLRKVAAAELPEDGDYAGAVAGMFFQVDMRSRHGEVRYWDQGPKNRGSLLAFRLGYRVH